MSHKQRRKGFSLWRFTNAFVPANQAICVAAVRISEYTNYYKKIHLNVGKFNLYVKPTCTYLQNK